MHGSWTLLAASSAAVTLAGCGDDATPTPSQDSGPDVTTVPDTGRDVSVDRTVLDATAEEAGLDASDNRR
jgi:hypothetical protein